MTFTSNSSGVAKAAFLMALFGLGKAYNVIGDKPPVVTAETLSGAQQEILVAHFDQEFDGDSEGVRDLGPTLTTFSEPPFTNYRGAVLATKAWRRLGLRLYLNPNIAMTGAEELLKFFVELYIGSSSTTIVFSGSQLLITVPNSARRYFDTGLVDIGAVLTPYGQKALAVGVDNVSAGVAWVKVAPGQQRVAGTLTIYGEE